MKNSFTIYPCTVLLILSSFYSNADCSYDPNAHFNSQKDALLWQKLISESANQDLRNAWQQGNCRINQGPHFGGQPPPGGDGATLHVTVRYPSQGAGHTCHVFHQLNIQNQTLTTCN